MSSHTIRALPYRCLSQNLPEGFVRRYISERLARTARVDDMYLLALQQGNGIGHLSFVSDIPRTEVTSVSVDEIIAWDGKQSLFPELLEKYYLSGITSGMQPKVGLPVDRDLNYQNDVIVKSFSEEFEHLPINEFVCMSAAKYAGFDG
jgi:serine/threonine-protein kinase HipA